MTREFAGLSQLRKIGIQCFTAQLGTGGSNYAKFLGKFTMKIGKTLTEFF